MPKGYWIGRVDVHDVATYRDYAHRNGGVIELHGGRFLVRGGSFENPEGSSRSRNVVIEFPTYEDAIRCYESPEYQELVRLRAPAGVGDLVIIEGYAGLDANVSSVKA